jgi:Leucine-rich repeat (LRR) protein
MAFFMAATTDCDVLVNTIFPAIGYTNAAITTLNCCTAASVWGTVPFFNCTATSQISHMVMKQQSLSGTIPTEFSQLSALQYVGLQDNPSLKGSIDEFTGLTSLWHLWAFNTAISGPIPPTIGGMKALTDLDLSNTQLTSSIPPEIGRIPYLSKLRLANTGISGNATAELANMAYLQVLDLSGTQLSGSLPESFDKIPVRSMYACINLDI